jgi:hypothetical protein
MGRTKWFDDDMAFGAFPRGSAMHTSPGKSRYRRQASSVSGWWFHLQQRFRRTRAAIRYWIDLVIRMLFSKSTLFRLSLLAMLSFIIFDRKGQIEVLSSAESTRLVHVNEPLSTPAESGILSSVDVLPSQPLRGGAEARKFAAPANPHAPVSADDIADPNVKAYVIRFSKVAKDEMQRFGVPASISLAQGLIESRAGTSKLARQNNNHFGIKCFSKNCGKGHCSNHFDDHHKDFFRKFNTPWESWRAHSKMLAEGRYKPLTKHGNDYKKWAHGLQQLGYATDKTYGSKLVDIIERYKLYRYDM